jgi:hypothetical protein
MSENIIYEIMSILSNENFSSRSRCLLTEDSSEIEEIIKNLQSYIGEQNNRGMLEVMI